MRLLLVLLVCAACARSEPRVPWRDPVRFVLADSDLDSASVRLSVLDHVTGAPVRAILCLDGGLDSAVAANDSGIVTVRGLTGGGNLSARVFAPAYDSATLVFQPGRRGRMQAQVRLTQNGAASATPSCSPPAS